MSFLFFRSPIFLPKPSTPAHRKIFETFFKIYHQNPELFPWITPSSLSKKGLLFKGFRSESFRKYAGLEIGLLTSNYFGYVRLPGALPGGEGMVETGTHHISFTYLQGFKKHFLSITKSADATLHLIQGDSKKVANRKYHFIKFNFYDYSLFTEEMFYCLHHYLTQKKEIKRSFQYPVDLEEVVHLAEE
ncbi:hypothetical protein [Chitinophaga sp. HK235]|uniref:hypothetical protein n=1 Tax=Chitinophaga sp. HK235 TaxID=2952571 RepID=UPI001BACE453|nr:hypothetical protein [Chitinophaga sp. HK235]